jgi:hypothetical protein
MLFSFGRSDRERAAFASSSGLVLGPAPRKAASLLRFLGSDQPSDFLRPMWAQLAPWTAKKRRRTAVADVPQQHYCHADERMLNRE